MTDVSKVKPSHLRKAAFIYVRQSSPSQVEHNRESTQRQYALVNKALEFGWSRELVSVIDDDLVLVATKNRVKRGNSGRKKIVESGHGALEWRVGPKRQG